MILRLCLLFALLNGPRNATTTAKGRTYKWRDESFDSVTTILGGGIPKKALVPWGMKAVAEYVAANIAMLAPLIKEDPAGAIALMKGAPYRSRDKAADLGTSVHEWAERHTLGQPQPQPSPEQAPYVASLLAFLEEWKPEFEMSEATVYSRTYGYAGTLDFIARLPGLGLVLGDYKSGKGVYAETAVQLAAYRYADFIGLPDGTEHPVPTVDACVVVHLTPTGYHVIPVQADEEALRFFRYAAQVRYFVDVHSRRVLGAPLPSPLARPVAAPAISALID